MNRDELKYQALMIPLEQLAKQVIQGNFIPGIHDEILIRRCRAVDAYEKLERSDG